MIEIIIILAPAVTTVVAILIPSPVSRWFNGLPGT